MAVVRIPAPRPRRFRYRSRFDQWAIERPVERLLTNDELYRLTGCRRPAVVLAELQPDEARPLEQDRMAQFANRFDCDAFAEWVAPVLAGRKDR